MITPYLHFQGNCAQAMTAYQAALGGELTLMRYADMPDAPPELAASDLVMNAMLVAGELGTLRASDFPPGVTGDAQAAVTVCLETDDSDRGRRLFDELSAGGAVIQPYGPSFFTDGFGMFADRFGTHWMVVAGARPEA